MGCLGDGFCSPGREQECQHPLRASLACSLALAAHSSRLGLLAASSARVQMGRTSSRTRGVAEEASRARPPRGRGLGSEHSTSPHTVASPPSVMPGYLPYTLAKGMEETSAPDVSSKRLRGVLAQPCSAESGVPHIPTPAQYLILEISRGVRGARVSIPVL